MIFFNINIDDDHDCDHSSVPDSYFRYDHSDDKSEDDNDVNNYDC